MSTPLNPRTIFLLERYTALPYYQAMRDHLANMLDAAEEALRVFMTDLPPDYRSWHPSEQPDVSWGEVVLPNLRWTMQAVEDGLVQIKAGELSGLAMAGNVKSAFAGMNRDYVSTWMSQPHFDAFWHHYRECSHLASNIAITERGAWAPTALIETDPQAVQARGPLNAPSTWPLYRLNGAVRVKTDALVPQTGVYLPDASLSSPQFLIEGYKAWAANVGDTPALEAPYHREPTTWTLVERIADSGGGTPRATDSSAAGIRLRVIAGNPCPQAGFWCTPAKLDSRKRFAVGDNMPSVGGDYGITIWQWDEDQR
jgi:hypothetical protein